MRRCFHLDPPAVALACTATLAAAVLTACGGGTGASGSCTNLPASSSAGVTWLGEKRFVYGTNWAWNAWGADFGGVSAWGDSGVSGASNRFSDAMQQMKSAGVSVVRWWMFPRFLTDSIEWSSDGAPSGIGGSLVADVREALALAEQHDVYVMLTPFSFDNFRPTAMEGGLYSRSIRPMVTDATLRQKLLQNLVKPVAQAVEASPYSKRMIAWDMVNEPEWAVSGPNLYGGEAFTPDSTLETVTHAQMETFLNEVATVLRANSSALLSVGGAAIKWDDAWLHVDQDFYMFHYYDWAYEWYPYTTKNPLSLRLTKPAVIGEFPNAGLTAVGPADAVAADLWSYGFAGALTWAFNDDAFPWDPAPLQRFSSLHPCETSY